jgi:toxin ParE1/3/4
MKARFTPRAGADRAAILDYLSIRSPVGARNVANQLRNAIDVLSSQPLNGHMTDMDTIRVLLVGKYPYKVFYRIGADAVEILHIRHTSRRPSEIE